VIIILFHNNNDNITISTDEYWAPLRKLVQETRKIMYNLLLYVMVEEEFWIDPVAEEMCYH